MLAVPDLQEHAPQQGPRFQVEMIARFLEGAPGNFLLQSIAAQMTKVGLAHDKAMLRRDNLMGRAVLFQNAGMQDFVTVYDCRQNTRENRYIQAAMHA